MEALQISELADPLRPSEDRFPSDIGPQSFSAAKFQLFQDTYFNYAGDLFDQVGVMETSFPSASAYISRDVDRYQRRFGRREEKCVGYEGSYLWITDQYSHFYYHWFCDALPRLAAALASHRCTVRRLLLPRRVYDKQYVRDSLKFWPDFELVVPPEIGGHGIVDRVLVSSRVNETPMVHPEHVGAVVDRYRRASGQPNNRQANRRIYVSRRNARVRRVDNEAEIKPVLERFGVETVAMEEMPLGKQIELMSQVELLVGAHGGGLTNMIFLPDQTPVLELRREIGPPACYYNLAHACRHPWYLLPCKPVDEDWHYHFANIVVDPEHLEAKLSAILGSSA